MYSFFGGFFFGYAIKWSVTFVYRTLRRFIEGGIRKGIQLLKWVVGLTKKMKR